MIGNPAVSVLLDAYQKGIREWPIEEGYQYSVNSVEKFGNLQNKNHQQFTYKYLYSIGISQWKTIREGLVETSGNC